ncbi:uncharacterized protein LOC122850655 [Aphidius gifuensis]|uniref:uncharacterized protein LOC122850655 n=1 Tax=Aphidius gifuensis TaxID=684658 RepID=UPI001CDCE2F4|nr:uncharacterized protein LOC122850655 [Aphidius gifuensis]
MLALLRQPLIKSVRIAQFGVKNFAQPIPRVLHRSYGSNKWIDCVDPEFLTRVFLFGSFMIVVCRATAAQLKEESEMEPLPDDSKKRISTPIAKSANASECTCTCTCSHCAHNV